MHFIDLFAGLGGFHLALKNLGHECVFASEIDETLRATYDENFGMRSFGDIREVAVESIPRPRHPLRGLFRVSRSPRPETTQGPETQSLATSTCRFFESFGNHHPQFLILEKRSEL